MFYDVFDSLGIDAQIADARWFLTDMDAASLGVSLEFFIVDGEEKILGSDFIVEGRTDKESDADLEREGAYEFVARNVFAIDRCLQGLVGEDVNADVDIDGVGNGFGAAWHQKGKACLKCVLKVCVGDVFCLDVGDAAENVFRSVNVHGVGHNGCATLITSRCGADTPVEDDGHTFVLAIGVVGLNLAGGGRFESHALRFLAHDCTSNRVGIDNNLA